VPALEKEMVVHLRGGTSALRYRASLILTTEAEFALPMLMAGGTVDCSRST